MSWLRIDHSLSALELKQILDQHGVFVLPGNQFFWNDRRQGERFIRVALARDAEMFREAVTVLGEACRKSADVADSDRRGVSPPVPARSISL